MNAIFKGAYWEVSKWISRLHMIEMFSEHEKGECPFTMGINLAMFATCNTIAETGITSLTLQKDIFSLFQDRETTGDVVLIGNSKEAKMKTHKLILEARSDYCRDLIGSAISKMHLLFGKPRIEVDLSSGLLWDFVRFIYSDNISL